MNVGFDDFPQGCLFIQNLAESPVAVGHVVGVAGQRALFALVFQVGQLELLGENPAQVVGAEDSISCWPPSPSPGPPAPA